MSETETMRRLIRETWGNKSLADLRTEAAKEFNGTKYSAIKLSDGRRLLLVACLTGEHEIKKALEFFSIDPRAAKSRDNWSAIMTEDVLMRAMATDALVYKLDLGEDGAVNALLIVAVPCSMEMVETALGLRP